MAEKEKYGYEEEDILTLEFDDGTEEECGILGVFDALGELVAVAVRGALEEGMFHKVGDAVQVVGFVAGAGVDDDAEVRDGRGHLFVDDADAVG